MEKECKKVFGAKEQKIINLSGFCPWNSPPRAVGIGELEMRLEGENAHGERKFEEGNLKQQKTTEISKNSKVNPKCFLFSP